MASLAEQKKAILPYLQRADEIDSLNPKVAYYCRVYAIQQGIQIPQRLPEIEGVLEVLMEKLEQDKPKLNITRDDAQECEAFAITVFNRADRQDRSGKADLRTVKAFYVATLFIDILRQFGDLPQDMVERQQYAAWKAADIRKALREGRNPQPGPPISEESLDLPDIPAIKHDGTESISQGPGTQAPPPKSDGHSQGEPPHLPSSRPVSRSTSPQKGVSQNQVTASGSLQSRFRPGSRVFYNAYDGPPVKGTVVSIQPSQYGNLCQVGLAQKVVEVPENRLAFDFAPGTHILYGTVPGTTLKGSVERGDTSRWPIAYLISLEDGQTLPTTEERLAPAETLPTRSPDARVTDNQNLPHTPAEPSISTKEPGEGASAGQGGQPGEAEHGNRSGLSPEDVQPDEIPANQLPGDIDANGAKSLPTEDGKAAEPSTSSYPDIDHQTTSGPSHAEPDGHIKFQPPLTGSAAPSHVPGHYLDVSVGMDSSFSGYEDSNKQIGHPQTGHFQQPDTEGMPQSAPSNLPLAEFERGGGQSLHPLPSQAIPSQASPRQLQAKIQQAAPPYHPPLHAITEAQKFSKYAASSLGFEDVPTAVKYLQQALDLLQGPSHP